MSVTVQDTLEHADSDCVGTWREERVGRLHCYRCPRCGAVARENVETRKVFWRQYATERLIQEAGRRGAIRVIIQSAVKADMQFEVALALGQLLDMPHRDHTVFKMIAEEYANLEADNGGRTE